MSANSFLAWVLFSFAIITSLDKSMAKHAQPITGILEIHSSPLIAPRWINQLTNSLQNNTGFGISTAVAVVLCFLAAAISSAGGVGGGGLYLPLLTILVGIDLKTASSYSAFMVTGGSFANVLNNLFIRSSKYGNKLLIDFDISLLSEPCLLLGVSIGVIWNVMFPEWLITAMFSVFLAWSTIKTFGTGIRHWKIESEEASWNGNGEHEFGGLETDESGDQTEGLETAMVPLLGGNVNNKLSQIPWKKVVMLIIIWLSFFIIYTLRGSKDGKSFIEIEPCGEEYWSISSLQIPLAIIFTTWIWYQKDSCNYQDEDNQEETETNHQGKPSSKLIFPLLALLAGILGGLFGIGGGMLISPMLLQAKIEPQVTAATCSFMVFFSSTMSAFQYLLMGMENTKSASIFALVCFTGSVLGLVIVQRGIEKHGRASLIIFSVGTVMALSTVLLTGYGVIDVWRDYTAGSYMGFKLPC